MSKVNFRIKVSFNAYKGPGSKKINDVLKEQAELIFLEATKEAENKAKQYAMGMDIPQVDPDQKNNIENPTGKLSESIFTYYKVRRGYHWESIITAHDDKASLIEYGTGIYGPERRPFIIYPKEKKALSFVWDGEHYIRSHVTIFGQRPKPFMRAAKWWVKENFSDILKRVSQKNGLNWRVK